jgi:hypothetical protein
MKIVLLLIASTFLLGACASSVTPDQLNATMAQAATLIANGCKIVQPTVAGVAPLTGNAVVAVGAAANGVFCAANEAAAAAAASAPAAK